MRLTEIATPQKTISEMITEPFDDFIKWLVGHKYYKNESKLMLGEADVSPESNTKGHKDSWAVKLFLKDDIIDNREFDRAVLGLKYFHSAYNSDKTVFDGINADMIEQICEFAQKDIPNFTTDEKLHAWCWSILFNDLGKLKKSYNHYKKIFSKEEPDHDIIMTKILQKTPEFFKGFEMLPPKVRKIILTGMKTYFNLGKAVQFESPEGSWVKINEIDADARNLYLGHGFFDFIGVMGADNPLAAPPFILNNNNVGAYLNIIINTNYKSYIDYRLALIKENDIDKSERIMFARLMGMFRCFEKSKSVRIMKAYDGLPEATKTILRKELVCDGINDTAIELMYSPALVANYKTETIGDIKSILMLMANIFYNTRIQLKDQTGVFTNNIIDIANAVKDDKNMNRKIKIQIEKDGAFTTFENDSEPRNFNNFDVSTIKNKKVLMIGIGGGSDVLQASLLGKMLDADVCGVISVRTEKTDGTERTIKHHDGEVADGVFKMKEETTGNGRFLENLPVDIFDTYLLYDPIDNKVLVERFTNIFEQLKPDVIVAVDTGGDVLYNEEVGNTTVSSPDQDMRVLDALRSISEVYKVKLAIICVGIDSPENSSELLTNMNATTFTITPSMKKDIISQYNKWTKRTEWLGKTPLVLQNVCNDNYGIVQLNIPNDLIFSPENPWNPFVNIKEDMNNIFFIEIGK